MLSYLGRYGGQSAPALLGRPLTDFEIRLLFEATSDWVQLEKESVESSEPDR